MKYAYALAIIFCSSILYANEATTSLFMPTTDLPNVAIGSGNLRISPDQNFLYSAAYTIVRDQVLLCDPNDLRPKARLFGSYPIDLSADGSLLATTSFRRDSTGEPHSFYIWNTHTGDLLTEVAYEGSFGVAGGSWLHALAFAPEANIIVASSIFDTVLRIYDVRDGNLIGQLEGHTERINSMAFSNTGELLASGSRNGETFVWDIEKMVIVNRLPEGVGIVSSLEFSPDDALLAVSDRDRVRVWEVSYPEAPSLLFVKDKLFSTYPNVAFSPDGRILAITKSRTVMFLDLGTGDEIFRVTAENYHPVRNAGALLRDIEFSPDSRYLFLAMGYGLQKIDLVSRKLAVVTKDDQRP